MAEAQSTGRDTLPKIGRVNEVCREWLIREDGALAYRLQNEEISEHYTGNRYRNAQLREDFPTALDEQIREQELAEQAAALYHQMIVEQEEQDALVAKQLAEKIEREEQARRRAIEEEDEEIARQLLEREKLKQQRLQIQQQQQQLQQQHQLRAQYIEQHTPLNNRSPRKPEYSSPQKHQDYRQQQSYQHQQTSYHESPKRHGCPMPLPLTQSTATPSRHFRSSSDDLLNNFQQCSIADALELGLPVDDIDAKRMQEERDAELARKLQEQESSTEQIQLNRDRLLAIEAQDKELAKHLQERERAKVRRAKERAKQKALAKKQQMEQNPDQILPDDSYSDPVDLLQHPECSYNNTTQSNHSTHSNNHAQPMHFAQQNYNKHPQQHPSSQLHEDEVNYSYPVDMLPPAKTAYEHNLKQNYSPQKNYDARFNGYNSHKSEIRAMNGGYLPGGSQGFTGSHLERDVGSPAVRPTQLDLKAPISKSMKPRSPDPDSIEICDPIQPDNNYTQHANIAMAIDPTYSRRSTTSQTTPSSQDTSTLSTSTTSSTTSPAISLPPPDVSEDELSPVPPYMPIQGQRRTASLEKKKKRPKDGCKQQ